MTSNSSPEEQNKLSMYHTNTASYSIFLHAPALHGKDELDALKNSNRTLPACSARKAVAVGNTLQLKQGEERRHPEHP